MNRARSLLLACLIATAAACGGADPVPTTPTPTLFTEVFSGTLSPGGGQTFTFISQASGRVTVTVTALAPDSTSIMGVSLGTVAAGGACQVVIANDKATQLTAIIGDVGQAGNLCVRVYDPAAGVVVEPLTFDLTVVHP
jgi:hypothetical protein